MLGYYNYTVILTYLGTAIGFAGICFVLSGNLKSALICLMLSGFCDMFDGKIAATKKRTQDEKEFGIQIDSLNDLLCFGVLPALIVGSLLPGTPLRVICGSIYVLCALIRLAFFNVDEAQRQTTTEESRKAYRKLLRSLCGLNAKKQYGADYVRKNLAFSQFADHAGSHSMGLVSYSLSDAFCICSRMLHRGKAKKHHDRSQSSLCVVWLFNTSP